MEEPAFFFFTGKYGIYDLDSYVPEFLFDPPGEIIQKKFFHKTLFQAKKIHIPFCDSSFQRDPAGNAKKTQTIHGKSVPSLGLEI